MPTVSVVDIDNNLEEIPNTKTEYQVDTGDIIYEGIDDKGHQLPHGCLSGSCGACKIVILEGNDNVAGLSVVESNTVEGIVKDFSQKKGKEFLQGKTVRLSCRTRISGDIKIAILKG